MSPIVFNKLAEWLHKNAHRDFCPWANRYVYWLKEPVGWFVLALAASCLVGAFLSPLGWSVAAGLATVIALGLGFPWLATRGVHCELRPADMELSERQASHLCLTVTNYLPLPITGLCITGYLSETSFDEDDVGKTVDCTLARVPILSRAMYRLPLRPEYRGRYPISKPELSCSFPFGIWTARRPVEDVCPVLVRPLSIPVLSDVERSGAKWADHGLGKRPTTQGDFQGVRDFRDGDSLKCIHWAQSARNERLVVCERGGPQQQPIDVHLSTARIIGSRRTARENLAWRVRVAASLVDLLCARQIPFRMMVDGEPIALPAGLEGARRACEALALLPLDGCGPVQMSQEAAGSTIPTICVHAWDAHGHALADHLICIELVTPNQGYRTAGFSSRNYVDLDQDIAYQLEHILTEANHASFAC
jgi:uncharacterized protein (DUF58 family)